MRFCPRGGGDQGAEFSDDRAHIEIEDPVLDEVGARGFVLSGIFSSRRVRAAVELILHGRKRVIVIVRGRLLRLGQALPPRAWRGAAASRAGGKHIELQPRPKHSQNRLRRNAS